jgi:hypothetical protein
MLNHVHGEQFVIEESPGEAKSSPDQQQSYKKTAGAPTLNDVRDKPCETQPFT